MRIEKVNVNEEVFNTRDGFVVDVGYPDEVEPYWHIEVYNKEGKFIKAIDTTGNVAVYKIPKEDFIK